MSYDQLTTKKLFVGGLSNDVTQEMLTKKFKTFGKVASVDIHKKKSLTDDSTNVFAFVCLNATLQNINKCIRTYNDSVWNGRTMRLQIARENFLDRLAAERKDNSIVKEWSLNNNNNNKSNNNNNKKTSVTINDKTSNKVLKYVSSEDDSDSDEESEPGNNDATSSDDDDSSDEEQRGGARMKETNHKSERSGVDPKADKASKKRKADDDDDSDDADEDEESDEEMSNKKIKLESQEDMLAEKKKNLEILTSVVGGKKSEKRKLPLTFSSQNSSMQRYDPSKPGHEEFEVREEEEDDDDGMTCEPIAKKAKMEADDDDDDSSSDEEDDDDDEAKETNNKQTTQTSATLTTSDVKQFAEVSSTVVDAFKKSEEFKLSSLFGNDEDEEDDEDGDHTIAQPPAKRPKLMTDMFGWDKEDVEDEESDDNDRSDDEGKMVKKRKKKLKVEDTSKKAGGKIKKTVAGKSGKFFFMANDPRLSEGNTFYRTDDLEELRKKWEELRPQYVDSYRLRKRRYRMGKSRM